MHFILASSSPRRLELLSSLNFEFHVIKPEIDERRLRGEPAVHYVKRLAQLKAEVAAVKADARFKNECWAVLAADTTVVLGNKIFNKPESPEQAYSFLKTLSGKTHDVVTGFCWMGFVRSKSSFLVSHVRTKVQFSKNSNEFWKWYVSTKEPLDKAGAYAAQGIGMSFIEKVSGSYSNVIGLPLPQVLRSFNECFGVSLHELTRKH
jgi:septum formation protein